MDKWTWEYNKQGKTKLFSLFYIELVCSEFGNAEVFLTVT